MMVMTVIRCGLREACVTGQHGATGSIWHNALSFQVSLRSSALVMQYPLLVHCARLARMPVGTIYSELLK